MDLFVYGTLMDAALVLALTGRRFSQQPAQLSGYRRVSPKGTYPYILPEAAATVNGVVLRDVDDDALQALDAYEEEGRLYRRMQVTVRVGEADCVCDTYVGIAAALTSPTSSEPAA